MCSTPSTPSVSQANTEVIATPTQADASVTKAGETARKNAGATARQSIKTTPTGLNSLVQTEKKQLLGQ
jgi:hypothetical protein